MVIGEQVSMMLCHLHIKFSTVEPRYKEVGYNKTLL